MKKSKIFEISRAKNFQPGFFLRCRSHLKVDLLGFTPLQNF